jgi:hypothetical protein
VRLRLADWNTRTATWDSAVAEPRAAHDPGTSEFAQHVLEAQLDRAIAASRAIDDKAALVIPAIGVILSVAAPNIDTALDRAALSFGLIAAAGAIAAAVSALFSLAPWWRLSLGPLALKVVRGTSDPPDRARSEYLKSLGFAVHSTSEQIIVKANWLSLSIVASAIGVIAFVLLVVAGGLK